MYNFFLNYGFILTITFSFKFISFNYRFIISVYFITILSKNQQSIMKYFNYRHFNGPPIIKKGNNLLPYKYVTIIYLK